ncbi:MAG: class I SAM-dependent methyltransferase [Candidatus Omnitrophota bacterium]
MNDRKDLFRGFSPEAMEARCQGRMMVRRELLVTEFLKAQGFKAGASVLELGAGTGQTMARVAQDFQGVSFLGVEPLGQYVDYAARQYSAKNPCLKYAQGTAEEIPLPDASVDGAYSINIWHHVPLSRLYASVQALAHVIKPGGCLFLIEPNSWHPYIFSYQWLTPGERCFLPWRELSALKASFTLERTRYCFLFPEAVRTVSPFAQKIETALEGVPFLGGSVVYTFRR